MESIDRKKIMVGLDGSEQALDAVRYVARMLAPQRIEVALFHVMTRIPESFRDLERSSAYSYRIANVEAWEKLQEKSMSEFMERANGILIDAGIPKDFIQVNIQERRDGIARDIISESHKGYDAVVVGRKGLSRLKDLVLGSVADRLIGRLSHVPIWVVGDNPISRKVLIPMDSSEGSMGAVDYAASMLKGVPDVYITLFHAIRGLDLFLPGFGDSFVINYEEEWVLRAQQELKIAEKDMEATFTEAEHRLLAAGFESERVTHKIIRGVSSRAGTIAHEAEDGDYGTIVMGRRGLSKVEEFFMGRVSSKVLHLARSKVVWVVS